MEEDHNERYEEGNTLYINDDHCNEPYKSTIGK